MTRQAGRPGAASSDAVDRLAFLEETRELLWPNARLTRARQVDRPNQTTKYLALGPRSPRLLLPAERRAALGAVLTQQPQSRQHAVRRAALAALVATGLGPRLLRHHLAATPAFEGIDAHLSDTLGEQVTTALAITPRRANRKPVLQILNRAGHTVGFAKVGHDALTDALVCREADVLQHLANSCLHAVRPPKVLHRGRWRQHAIVVLSALPTRAAHQPAPPALAEAMRELAECDGVGAYSPAQRYFDDLQVRAQATTRATDEADHAAAVTLRDLVIALTSDGPAQLRIGAWHGDWTPWNCCVSPGDSAVLVWDWERFAVGVPLGFDALHYRLQTAVIRTGLPHREAAHRCVTEAADVLSHWNVPASDARLVAKLYLAEIGLRYVADRQRSAGAAGGRIENWIIPALQSTGQGRSAIKEFE